MKHPYGQDVVSHVARLDQEQRLDYYLDLMSRIDLEARHIEWVYVAIMPTGLGEYIKVGVTSNPKKRLQQLKQGKCAMPFDGDWTAVTPDIYYQNIFVGSRHVEKQIHLMLSPWNVGGEWFVNDDCLADALSFAFDDVCDCLLVLQCNNSEFSSKLSGAA